jgi:hypothetical protein
MTMTQRQEFGVSRKELLGVPAGKSQNGFIFDCVITQDNSAAVALAPPSLPLRSNILQRRDSLDQRAFTQKFF